MMSLTRRGKGIGCRDVECDRPAKCSTRAGGWCGELKMVGIEFRKEIKTEMYNRLGRHLPGCHS